MIRFIGKVPGFSRKIVIAGEMLELGKESAELHSRVADGGRARRSEYRYRSSGNGGASSRGSPLRRDDRDRLKFVPDAAASRRMLAGMVRSGDVILIKGSRGVKLEQALQTLRTRFAALEN